MIEDSEKGMFDVLIVHKLDRFSRDKYDSAKYKRKLKKNGVQLLSVTENLDGSPESVILESLLEGMAEYYSKNLAREVMKGLKETTYQCKHTGGLPPISYSVVPVTKQYGINEDERSIVETVSPCFSQATATTKSFGSSPKKATSHATGPPSAKAPCTPFSAAKSTPEHIFST